MDGDTRGWLEIDAATGQIKTKTQLDREIQETLDVTVTAYEKGEIIHADTADQLSCSLSHSL